ncbi:MAG: dihydropteroate synthase [Firmicutes bacterium]|nr:dihydropteroate synthase [Bacillota bacterium]
MITILSGTETTVEASPDKPTVVIGERINPTRKKELTTALREGRLELVEKEALAQKDEGADVIDVNVGAPGVDEIAILPQAVRLAAEATGLPVSIDSSHPKAIEAALKVCPGKPLINSVSGETKSLEKVLPLARDYGAAVIGLCLDDSGISTDPMKRLEIAKRILERACALGIPVEDVVFDPVVTAVGIDHTAGKVTLETMKLISGELKANLALGSSNISHGLPYRPYLNNSFLALSILNGATLPIVNPGAPGLMETVRGTDLLLGKDIKARRYLKLYRDRLKKPQI